MRIVLALLTALLSLGMGVALWRKTRRGTAATVRTELYAVVGGLLTGAACYWLERSMLRMTGLDFEVRTAGVSGALMAVFLLAAPLEEGAKVLVVWPLYRTRRLYAPRLGVCYAGACASGFAASEAVLALWSTDALALTTLRVVLNAVAQIFFAGAWGFALGAGRIRGRWFSITWLGAVLLHALYDHIVWGRGPGYLMATVPMLAFMAFGAAIAFREMDPAPARHVLRLEPPSLREVRDALRPAERPVMLRWVGVGAFVTLGLVLTFSALSVLIGRRIGIDFTLADEADVRSAGPLALLGTGVIAAFPLAGYLIARASSAHSMLEPALATLLALAALVAILALTAPVAVLFALAVTPVAIGLACGGAWVGIER